MKKLIIVALLIYGGYLAYEQLNKPSPANLTYQKFAEAMTRGNLTDARDLATGPEKAKLEKLLQPPPPTTYPAGSPLGLYQSAMSPQALEKMKKDMTNEMAGSIQKITHKIESEDTSNGNKVSIAAIQTVHRTGTAAHRGGVTVKFKHKVELVKEGDAWKVYSFKEEK